MVVGDWDPWDDGPSPMPPYVEVTVTERETAELWTPDGLILLDIDPRPKIRYLP